MNNFMKLICVNILFVYVTLSSSQTLEWKSGPTLPLSRFAAGCASLNDNIYVVGGIISDSIQPNSSRQLDVFNIGSNQWSTMASTDSNHGSATIIFDNLLYSIGGTSEKPSNRVEVYNISTNTWSYAPSLNLERSDPEVVMTESHIVVIGGRPTTESVTMETYSLISNVWNKITLPKELSFIEGSYAISSGDQIYFVANTLNVTGTECRIYVAVLNFSSIINGVFEAVTYNSEHLCRYYGSITLSGQQIWMVGGSSILFLNSNNSYLPLEIQFDSNTPSYFNMTSKSWFDEDIGKIATVYPCSVWAQGNLYVLGGIDDDTTVLNSVWIMRPYNEPDRSNVFKFEIIVVSSIGAITLIIVLAVVIVARRDRRATYQKING